ncbi:MAG: DUF305 domain-containing protein [Clostridia bacterium]
MKNYYKFFGMIIVSTITMYVFNYLTTFESGHVIFSETRLYMAILMGATMAIIMLAFMTHMLKNTKLNIGIVLSSIVIFSISLFLVRSQMLVDDVDYMKAMIPHHSVAILTSERAELTDPRVRELAEEIIEAQRREIEEMKDLIEELDK